MIEHYLVYCVLFLSSYLITHLSLAFLVYAHRQLRYYSIKHTQELLSISIQVAVFGTLILAITKKSPLHFSWYLPAQVMVTILIGIFMVTLFKVTYFQKDDRWM